MLKCFCDHGFLSLPIWLTEYWALWAPIIVCQCMLCAIVLGARCSNTPHSVHLMNDIQSFIARRMNKQQNNKRFCACFVVITSFHFTFDFVRRVEFFYYLLFYFDCFCSFRSVNFIFLFTQLRRKTWNSSPSYLFGVCFWNRPLS